MPKGGMLIEILRSLERKRQESGQSQADFCRPAGISDQTWQNWMRQEGGFQPRWTTLEKLLTSHNLRLKIDDGSGTGDPASRPAESSWSTETRTLATLAELLPPNSRMTLVREAERAIRALTHTLPPPPSKKK